MRINEFVFKTNENISRYIYRLKIVILNQYDNYWDELIYISARKSVMLITHCFYISIKKCAASTYTKSMAADAHADEGSVSLEGVGGDSPRPESRFPRGGDGLPVPASGTRELSGPT